MSFTNTTTKKQNSNKNNNEKYKMINFTRQQSRTRSKYIIKKILSFRVMSDYFISAGKTFEDLPVNPYLFYRAFCQNSGALLSISRCTNTLWSFDINSFTYFPYGVVCPYQSYGSLTFICFGVHTFSWHVEKCEFAF